MRIRAQKAHAERVRIEARARQEERKRQMQLTEREKLSEREQSVRHKTARHTTPQPSQPPHMSVKQAVADLMAEAFFDPKVLGSIRTYEVADAYV
jgi:hypothetical protein